ncbi:MAG: glycosyltransferase family 2 protein [Candidatus Avilachnospira sp.]
MKLLSVAVPCYNSAAYMRRCIDSILTGGDRVEIIIVDDGSTKDETLEIAREYERRYPTICKAVHQENGGHGEAVNTGLKNSSGVYFKVVDSDDRLDENVLGHVLDKLEEFVYGPEKVDMLCCNFVYDKQGVERKKVMSYKTAFPIDEVFEWKDVKFFMLGQYLLMHSVIYRTELLKSCGLELPKHTFYVDNIYVYYPLPYVKKMYYMNENLYRYFIGREDQSVNESIMIGRIDQQIRVTKIMIDSYDVLKIQPRKLRKYMMSYLNIMMTVSSILAIRSGSEENMEKKRELWNYLKEKNFRLWLSLRSSFLGQGMNMHTKFGNKLTELGYTVSRKFYGFN